MWSEKSFFYIKNCDINKQNNNTIINYCGITGYLIWVRESQVWA